MMEEFISIRSKIIKLHFKIDTEIIKSLKRKGYNINTSSRSLYEESLDNALSRSEGIITRISLKLREMEKDSKKSETEDRDFGFEEIIAQLNVGLGFNVDDSLTLARFNEYKKIISKRNANKKSHGRRE